MKILVVNQPLNNRGDEAAHRSLMRGLNERFKNDEITVLFSGSNPESIKQMEVEHVNNNYVNIEPSGIKGRSLLNKWSLRLDNINLSLLHPDNIKISHYIKSSDLVLCAPGGICMGLFQSWEHIYILSLALQNNKKIAYYSRSFGPFPEQSKWNQIFKKRSYKLLKYFDFLSIRDSKTMSLADNLGLSYIEAVDTAFLNTPNPSIPTKISQLLDGKEYVVFVPNSLTWHPAFTSCPPEYLEKFYLSVIELLFKTYPESNIVMLPQLFNQGDQGDHTYFINLKEKSKFSNRLMVISDEYSSDVQQSIISKAQLMIGARYHSVVFAVNNQVPFVALSYEHKVSGLLQILGLQDKIYDIEKFGLEMPPIDNAMNEISKILKNSDWNYEAKGIAENLAVNCMDNFYEKYNS
jgi:colanic acid/amylovoran biosynthesis protein